MRQFNQLIPSLDPVSNQATWRDTVELRDEDNELIDLEEDVTEITFRVREEGHETVELEATLTGGEIEVVGLGTFEFVFTVTQMQGVEPKTYEAGVTVTADGDTEQVILGHVPVLRGL